MKDYLLFRLYGPMAAWGDVAVGEYRPSYAHPGKSAILGLLAAAKGIRRQEEHIHQQMAAGYGLAIAVEASGMLLRDYHTSQVPPQQRKVVHYTRRDELRSSKLNTILSTRDYRCDGLYKVCLWIESQDTAPYSLVELRKALHHPRFVLYLGRKSCPPALPLEPTVLTAESLEIAFAQAKFSDDFINDDSQSLLGGDKLLLYYWEETEEAGFKTFKIFTRRDVPLSRRRWQFADRPEHYFARQKGKD